MKISHDEKYIFCTSGPRVNILQIFTGKIVHSIEQVNVYNTLIEVSNPLPNIYKTGGTPEPWMGTCGL